MAIADRRTSMAMVLRATGENFPLPVESVREACKGENEEEERNEGAFAPLASYVRGPGGTRALQVLFFRC